MILPPYISPYDLPINLFLCTIDMCILTELMQRMYGPIRRFKKNRVLHCRTNRPGADADAASLRKQFLHRTCQFSPFRILSKEQEEKTAV